MSLTGMNPFKEWDKTNAGREITQFIGITTTFKTKVAQEQSSKQPTIKAVAEYVTMTWTWKLDWSLFIYGCPCGYNFVL